MRDGNVIFDGVIHVHNRLNENFDSRLGRVAQEFKYDIAEMYKRGVEEVLPRDRYFTVPPSPELVASKVFGEGSQVDWAMAQVVPLFEMYNEPPEHNVARVYELSQLDDRIIFCGGTDPVFRGVPQALRDVEHQIQQLGARSIKLYTGHSYGMSWRMDDRVVAYPLFDKMLELGCNLVQVHKGDPQGMEPLHTLHPGDVHQAAVDFPEMNFIVHHLAFPFDDDAIDLGARLPNVYLSMSTWINMINIAPMEVATRLGKLLLWCRPEKILYGSEVPLWPSSQKLLDFAWNLQIPEELQVGWGYPEITDEDRRLMFGGNMLRLLGMPYEPPVAAPVLFPPAVRPTQARPGDAAIAAVTAGAGDPGVFA